VENVTKTYICYSCGRISTMTLDTGHCISCGGVTDISPEDAVEIPIPKCEFGTDFIAVVYRGRVVDILLASDRTSVHGYLWGELVRVQDYVDHLKPTDETRKTTDIEVEYGNNVYVVRLEDGVPRILIPAISSEVELGDRYLSASMREQILALALSGMPSSSEGKRIIEIASGQKRRSEKRHSTTGTQRKMNQGHGGSGCLRTLSTGLRHMLEQFFRVVGHIIEVVLGRERGRKMSCPATATIGAGKVRTGETQKHCLQRDTGRQPQAIHGSGESVGVRTSQDNPSPATTSSQTAVPLISGGQHANRRATASHRSGAAGDTSAPAGTNDRARTYVHTDARTRARDSSGALIGCNTKIPDYISPFVAYRTWEWDSDGLRSLNYELWPAGAPLEANANHCAFSVTRHRRIKTNPVRVVGKDWLQREHIAPAKRCTCGIYAAKNFEHLQHIGYTGEDADYAIHGEVYLWGRIWEHDLGYRAQFAYPKNLTISYRCLPWPIKEVQERLKTLTQYGVDMYLQLPGVEKAEGFFQQTSERVFLWSKETGFNPRAIDDLIADNQECYTLKDAPISLEVGDTLAILGTGLGFIKKVLVDSVQVLMFNRLVSIHASYIKFNKHNFRWESSSQGIITRL
jgi:hypothetical protein